MGAAKSKSIERSELKPGYHISCRRGLYSHHGIYVRENRVVHFGIQKLSKQKHCENCGDEPRTPEGVVMTCLDCFINDDSLRRVEYEVLEEHLPKNSKLSGNVSNQCSEIREAAVRRAMEMLNGETLFGYYDKFHNNCECFAFYCVTGVRWSRQTWIAKGILNPLSFLTRRFYDPYL